jgi:phage terminase small subunit
MPRPRKPVSEKRKNNRFSYAKEGDVENPVSPTLSQPIPPPSDMDKVARDVFLRIQLLLIDMRMLQEIDVLNLELASRHYSEYIGCREAIAKKYKTTAAYLIECAEEKTPPILYTIAEKNLYAYRRILERFGASPVDRTRATVPTKKRKNKLDGLMGDGGDE